MTTGHCNNDQYNDQWSLFQRPPVLYLIFLFAFLNWEGEDSGEKQEELNEGKEEKKLEEHKDKKKVG